MPPGWARLARAPFLGALFVFRTSVRLVYPESVLQLAHFGGDEQIMNSDIGEALSPSAQLDQLERLARERNWGLSLALVGWLHLLAFSVCYYLTIVRDYHEAAGYLIIWTSELLGAGLIFRLCGGPRPADAPAPPLERFIVRVWTAYFILSFNLGTLNTLRGNRLFELFPAMASLASFAFLVMAFTISRWFYAAVVVMFAAGLLMAEYLLHAYLIFAIAWWLVLNSIGVALFARCRSCPVRNHRA
jgi:hypothetical protein